MRRSVPAAFGAVDDRIAYLLGRLRSSSSSSARARDQVIGARAAAAATTAGDFRRAGPGRPPSDPALPRLAAGPFTTVGVPLRPRRHRFRTVLGLDPQPPIPGDGGTADQPLPGDPGAPGDTRGRAGTGSPWGFWQAGRPAPCPPHVYVRRGGLWTENEAAAFEPSTPREHDSRRPGGRHPPPHVRARVSSWA